MCERFKILNVFDHGMVTEYKNLKNLIIFDNRSLMSH